MKQREAETRSSRFPLSPLMGLVWGGLCLLTVGLCWNTSWAGNSDNALVAKGKALFASQGCLGCHSVDGTRRVGPTMYDLVGKKVKLTNGQTVERNRDYLKNQLMAPQRWRVPNYPPLMPSYKGKVDVTDIDALWAYLKSLKAPKENDPNAKKLAPAVIKQAEHSRQYALKMTKPTPKRLAVGKHYYSTNCSFCHGVKGHGDGPAARGQQIKLRNFAKGEYLYGGAPQVMFDLITHGSARTHVMPAWGHFPERVRWALVTYILSMKNAPKK
ncbi:MAG: c-type cytochrome [Deltaproteobacteria bacterium]|nr:MAG: c-type cytochrome [Deltaproteobacteria bacterium]